MREWLLEGPDIGAPSTCPHLDIDGVIQLDSLSKDVDPLAEVCKLPHVAQAVQDGVAAIHSVINGLVACRHRHRDTSSTRRVCAVLRTKKDRGSSASLHTRIDGSVCAENS